MKVCIVILLAAFIILYFMEHARYKSLNRELFYISECLNHLPNSAENRLIRIPSDHACVKALAANLNRFLQSLYHQKAGYIKKGQAMERVFTNISHDLRTPLTVLKGYSELLCRSNNASGAYESDRGKKEILFKIDQKADELVAVIDAYFTLSKLESGDIRLEIQKLNLSKLCHELLLSYYNVLEQKQFHVDIQIEEEPVYVNADPDALERILKNLTDNAIKYGGSGNYLALRLAKKESFAEVELEDHGKGILKEDLERIFIRNYTASEDHSGSGLGLAIAKSLAEQMGADIHVFSEPKKKTIFTLRLKCCSDFASGS